MYKELHFVNDSLYRLALIIIENLAVVGLVFSLRSVEAWVGSLVIAASFEVVISFLFFQLRPRFQYQAQRAKVIFDQAKVLSLSSFFSYLIENVDNLIIGKVVGEYGLGLYQPTYALAHEPNYEVAKSVHHGTLPIYTKIIDQPTRLRRAFLRTAGLTIVGGICLTLPLFIAPDLIVNLVLGDKWLSAVPLVQVLSLAGILHAMAMVCYAPLIAQRRVDLMNIHMGVTVLFFLGLIYFLGQKAGLTGAVWGVVIARLLTLPYLLITTWRQLRIT